MVYFELIKSFLEILFLLLFLFIPGFYFLKVLDRKYFNNNISILLSCPASIFIFGLIFLFLQILSSPPIVYLLVTGGFIIFLLLIAYKKGLINELLKIQKIYQYAILLILIGATIAAYFVSIDNEGADEINSWLHSRKIAERGLFTLPGDNYIPYQTAMVFIENSEPWVSKNWTMGDRTPLMGIINCIWSYFTLNSENYSFQNYEIVGIVLNILFILPCTIISRRIFRDPHVYYIVPIAILLNTFIFRNIYYTWPKLMGAFFILSIITLLMNKRIGYLSMSISGILAGMAFLSHGAAILSLPILLLLSMIFLFKLKNIKYLVPLFGFLLLLQFPWLAYKKLHPSINTNNLLYHYIPTEIYQDDPIKTLTNYFKTVPIKEQIDHRYELIKRVVSNNLNMAFKSLYTGNLIGYYNKIRTRGFHCPIIAVGEFQLLLCIPVLSYLIICYFLLNQKKILLNFNFKLMLLFFSLIILSYLFNTVIKWNFSANHTLSYAELIIGISLISGISFSLLKPIRIISFSLIIVHFCYYVISSAQRQGFQIFDFFNLLVIVGVIILIYFSQNFVRSDPKSKLMRKAV